MSNGDDRKPVSVLMWMLLIFLAALPCIGPVLIIAFAFVGENETRKNYFRALIVWFLILALFWTGIMLLGFAPAIVHHIQIWIESWSRTR